MLNDCKWLFDSPVLQLENIGNFIKAITRYGVKPHDIFEANDLFENTNYTQVQSTLIALASMVSCFCSFFLQWTLYDSMNVFHRYHPNNLILDNPITILKCELVAKISVASDYI